MDCNRVKAFGGFIGEEEEEEEGDGEAGRADPPERELGGGEQNNEGWATLASVEEGEPARSLVADSAPRLL